MTQMNPHLGKPLSWRPLSRASATAVLLGLALTVSTQSAAEPRADGGSGDIVTLLHWWSAPSELAAVGALTQFFLKSHPGTSLRAVDARSKGGGARVFQVVSTATRAGTAPNAIHVNAGAPLKPYLDSGLLSPLDEIWEGEGLTRVIPARIREMCRRGDRHYAVPIAVHRDNLLWYNKSVLQRHGIDPGSLTSWESVFAAAQKLAGSGVKHPFQMGANWTASLAFEGLVAGLGAATYQQWVNGRLTDPKDPRLLTAFGTLRRILSYAPPDHTSMTWEAAIQRVAQGDAAFLIMGDWVVGELGMAGLSYGEDYGAVPMPGTRGMYGVTVDAFAQPAGVADPKASERLLRAVASRAGQDAFNTRKGSIPPRSDASTSEYSAYQRAAMDDLKAARVVYPNIAGATHDAFKSGLDAIMSRFQADRDVAWAAAAVAEMTQQTQGMFDHAWSLE